jgi:hypothetical protein
MTHVQGLLTEERIGFLERLSSLERCPSLEADRTMEVKVETLVYATRSEARLDRCASLN